MMKSNETPRGRGPQTKKIGKVDKIFEKLVESLDSAEIQALVSSPTTRLMTYPELCAYLGRLYSNHSMVENLKVQHSEFQSKGCNGIITIVTYYRKFKYQYVYERIYTIEDCSSIIEVKEETNDDD